MTAAMRWTISLLGPRWLTAEEMSCKTAVVVLVVAVAMESVEAAIDDGAVDVSKTTELHWLYKTANPSPQSTK